MEVRIPASVTEIAEYAFYRSGITWAVIPDGITEIKEGTFGGCSPPVEKNELSPCPWGQKREEPIC